MILGHLGEPDGGIAREKSSENHRLTPARTRFFNSAPPFVNPKSHAELIDSHLAERLRNALGHRRLGAAPSARVV